MNEIKKMVEKYENYKESPNWVYTTYENFMNRKENKEILAKIKIEEIEKEIDKYDLKCQQHELDIKEIKVYDELKFQKRIKEWKQRHKKEKPFRYIMAFLSILPMFILPIVCHNLGVIDNSNIHIPIIIIFLWCIPLGLLLGNLSMDHYPTRNMGGGGPTYFTMGYYTEEL